MLCTWSYGNSRPSSPSPRSRGSAAPAIASTWSSPRSRPRSRHWSATSARGCSTVRPTGSSAPANAGRVFLPAARRTLAEAVAARETIEELRGGLRGTVRLGFFQAQRHPQVSLARILAAFAADHPCVEVRLSSGTSLAHADDLRARRLDLALVILPPGAVPGLEWHVLHSDESQLLVPASHPLAASTCVELGQLAGERFVDGPPGHALRVANDCAFAAANATRTVAYEVSDCNTIIEFIHYGVAVAILPPWVVVPADAVAAIPIRHHAPHFTTSIARAADHRARRRRTRAARYRLPARR